MENLINYLKSLNIKGTVGIGYMGMAAILIYASVPGWPWFLACAFVLTILSGV